MRDLEITVHVDRLRVRHLRVLSQATTDPAAALDVLAEIVETSVPIDDLIVVSELPRVVQAISEAIQAATRSGEFVGGSPRDLETTVHVDRLRVRHLRALSQATTDPIAALDVLAEIVETNVPIDDLIVVSELPRVVQAISEAIQAATRPGE